MGCVGQPHIHRCCLWPNSRGSNQSACEGLTISVILSREMHPGEGGGVVENGRLRRKEECVCMCVWGGGNKDKRSIS